MTTDESKGEPLDENFSTLTEEAPGETLGDERDSPNCRKLAAWNKKEDGDENEVMAMTRKRIES